MTSSAMPAAPGRVTYGGRRFRPGGGPDRDGGAQPTGAATTVGQYYQDGDLVWAEFRGPTVRVGRLVGTCRPDGVVDAAYCMVTAGGETVAGTCESTPTVLADGRVQVTERWRRMDGSSGVSYLEEITE